MPSLNNVSLQAFAEILRSGSFDAAARKLHITPSAVSQRIRQLEDHIGQVLIIRGNPSRPTAAGTLLYRHAQQLQALEENFFSELEQHGSPDIAVAVNTDSVDSWFLDVITEAAQDRIMLNIKVEDQAYSASLLREGRVMAAVSTDPTPVQGCSTEYLGTMHYTAFASPAFCKKHIAGGNRLENFIASPSIFFNEKDQLQHTFLKSVAGRDIEPAAMFIPSNSAYIEAVLRGAGWGMLPESMSGLPQCAGKIIPLFPETSVVTELYWHRWNIKLSSLDRLSQHVRNAARRGLKMREKTEQQR